MGKVMPREDLEEKSLSEVSSGLSHAQYLHCNYTARQIVGSMDIHEVA